MVGLRSFSTKVCENIENYDLNACHNDLLKVYNLLLLLI